MFAATIGFFDGVHRGHRCLIEQMKTLAAKNGLETLIVTMDRHPREVILQDCTPLLLTTTEERLCLLGDTGVNDIKVLHFDRQMSSLSAYDFMHRILRPLGVSMLLMGYDHHFGHGDALPDDYLRWGAECGIQVVHAHELEGEHISSTAIRALLAQGHVQEANKLLGHPYLLSGTVVSGQRLGRSIGFPTANISIPSEKLLPKKGVYAVRSDLGLGMMDIGTRPTTKTGGTLSVEVHLFDFSGDLYGKSLMVEILGFIREERTFDSLGSLKGQLEQDRLTVLRQYVSDTK